MVAELLPLHGLVTVDIDLFKEINQGEGDFVFEFFIFLVVVQVFEHYRDKFVNGKAFFSLLETLFDGGHLFAVQHLQYLILGNLLLIVLVVFSLLLPPGRTVSCFRRVLFLLTAGGH